MGRFGSGGRQHRAQCEGQQGDFHLGERVSERCPVHLTHTEPPSQASQQQGQPPARSCPEVVPDAAYPDCPVHLLMCICLSHGPGVDVIQGLSLAITTTRWLLLSYGQQVTKVRVGSVVEAR